MDKNFDCEENESNEVWSVDSERYQALFDPSHLRTKTLSELYQTIYNEKPPVIKNLLYPGAFLLVGAPKIGKSFLVAQLAYHVSRGMPLWGFEVCQGTVLYLALEDDYRRLQQRMFTMYGVNDTDKLHFTIEAGKVNIGLVDQLENFVSQYPDTNLIVVDTLQKIREIGGETYSYANDYDIISRMKSFADKHDL